MVVNGHIALAHGAAEMLAAGVIVSVEGPAADVQMHMSTSLMVKQIASASSDVGAATMIINGDAISHVTSDESVTWMRKVVD